MTFLKRISLLVSALVIGLILMARTGSTMRAAGPFSLFLPVVMRQSAELPAVTPTGTNTAMATSTQTPTTAPAETATPTPTETPTETPTSTPTETPTQTPTPTFTPTPTLAPARMDQNVFGIVSELVSASQDFQKINSSGADWTRPSLTLNWTQVELNEGERNWAALTDLDAQILAANQFSQTITLVIDGTPEWALIEPFSQRCGPINEAKYAAFASFLHDAVTRYAHQPFNVRVWELWNAPDRTTCWGDSDPVTMYGAVPYSFMLEQAYLAIKTADPYATVLVGPLEMRCNRAGMVCDQKTFAQALVIGSSNYYDGIAFQANDGLMIADTFWGTAYQYGNGLWNSAWNTTGPVALVKADYLTSQVPFYAKKLVAEISYQCLCDMPEFEIAKAGYVVQAYAATKSRNIQASFWNSMKGSYSSGLLNDDNSERQAYQAYTFASQMLGSATYVDVVQAGGDFPTGVRGYQFSRNGKTLLVLWFVSDFFYSSSIVFGTPVEIVWDTLGNPVQVTNNTVTIDHDHPMYIQFP